MQHAFRRTYNGKPLPIKRFDGTPEGYDDFLDEYHQQANAYGWTEDEKLERFPIHLTGMALDAYGQLPTLTLTTWDEMLVPFKGLIFTKGENQMKEISKQKIRDCKQEDGESVATFVYRLTKLIRRAYGVDEEGADAAAVAAENIKRERRNEVLMDQLWNGMKPQIRKQIDRTRYNESDRLIDKMKKIESNGISFGMAGTNGMEMMSKQ